MAGRVANLKPWQPGVSGNPGGKPKRLLPRVDEILYKAGLNPTDELMKLMPTLRPREQAEIWLELLAYCQAKPKHHDEAKEVLDELKALSTQELLKLVKENLPELAKDAG